MSGMLIDLRKEGIENRVLTQTDQNWVPNGETNIIFDIVASGKKVGDLEIGSDGFLQINIAVAKNKEMAFIKVNQRDINIKSYGADKGIRKLAEMVKE